jgi:formate hydrogenlyase subunit 3/multisubunit Na+/H+ antiporter MnhD subunit
MMILPAVALACGTVLFGLMPGVFMDIALRSADQLVNPAAYIEAVLGTPATATPESP